MSGDARATGGTGGAAGAGGGGLGDPGTPGRGGEARAHATATNSGGSANAAAQATGGNGGSADGIGARGGDGGTTSSTATARGDLRGATASVTSTGGSGGGGINGASGGDGAAVTVGSSDVVVDSAASDASLIQLVRATGGSGGGVDRRGFAGAGGDVLVDLLSTGLAGASYRMDLAGTGGRAGGTSFGGTNGLAGNASVAGNLSFAGHATVNVASTGGAGANAFGVGARHGGLGGDADAHASATSVAAGSRATTSLTVIGGQGGSAGTGNFRGGEGGTATGLATATATATGAASATLLAQGGAGGVSGALGGNGAATLLDNAVSGSGASVDLRQIARGGAGGSAGLSGGGSATGGRGGDATSLLDRLNAAGHLSLESTAQAGSGGDNGGVGGLAFASGVGRASGNVTVTVNALAGQAGFSNGIFTPIGADGALASVGPVLGESTGGGAVDVFASVNGGAGGDGADRVGAGADALLVDAVDGNTSGALRLRQVARAGNAGAVSGSNGASLGARGGEARSELTRTRSAARFDLELSARGGNSAGKDGTGVAFKGGDATSQADVRNETGEISIVYQTQAGAGARNDLSGATHGEGGAAVSSLRATSVADGQRVLITRSSPGNVTSFGSAGGAGGSASEFGSVPGTGGRGGLGRTDAEGVALANSEVIVEALAMGGVGGRAIPGQRAGDGGDAEAHAIGRNAGSSAVQVLAEARGGAEGAWSSGTGGALGANAGAARATAYGESTGGGNVTARARAIGARGGAGRAGDGILSNAVSGMTAGVLRLVQEALGGENHSGVAGRAESELEQSDLDGGRLELESIATGGAGGVAGVARAAAAGTGEADVTVLARATGGDGSASFASADGAVATLGRVYGESRNGGLVRVTGEAIGGAGSALGFGATATTSGSGANVVVEDAVDGHTSGRLELIQRATGGDAGGVEIPGLGGAAGSATNRLARVLRAGDLDLEMTSRGGDGAAQSSGTAAATRGANAITEAVVTNDSGRANLHLEARGGDGGRGLPNLVGGNGGDASLSASARTLADGHGVVIGGFDTRSYGAYGGHAQLRSSASWNQAGNGGNAASASTGTALGDSLVSIQDLAIGGDGYSGGNARSRAHGENAGAASVVAVSEAIAGRSSRPGGRFGDAIAEASSQSTDGESSARAIARVARGPGAFGVLESGAASVAQAIATANGGRAVAESISSGRSGAVGVVGSDVESRTFATGGTALSGESRVGVDARLAFESTRNAASYSTGIHGYQGEWGRFGLNLDASGESPDIFLRAESVLTVGSAGALDGISLSFMDLRVDDADFARLAFRIVDRGIVLLDEVFSDSAAARIFFSTVVDLGALVPEDPFGDPHALVFSLEGQGARASSGFGVLFSVGTVVVPEPGTAVLVMIGMVVLGSRRRPRSSRAGNEP